MWLVASLCLLAVHSVLGSASAACQAPAADAAAAVIHVTTVEGENAALPCPIDGRGAMTGWSRRIGDRCHLVALTVNSFHHSEAKRYEIIDWPHMQLVIQRTQWTDSGLYRCHGDFEDGHTPPATHWIKLAVIARDRTIISGGSGDRYVTAGQSLQLSCLSGESVAWFFNREPVNVTSERLRVGAEHPDNFLCIDNVTEVDAGTYSCHSKGLNPDSVKVEVVPSETASSCAPSGTARASATTVLVMSMAILKGGLS